jgi:WD40 repeat protein
VILYITDSMHVTGRSLGGKDQFNPLVSTLSGHSWAVLSVAYNSTGSRLLSASWDANIYMWDLATLSIVATFEGVYVSVICIGLIRSDTIRADGMNARVFIARSVVFS